MQDPDYFEKKTIDSIFGAIEELKKSVDAQGAAAQESFAEQRKALSALENKVSLIYGYASGVSIVASLFIAWIKSKLSDL